MIDCATTVFDECSTSDYMQKFKEIASSMEKAVNDITWSLSNRSLSLSLINQLQGLRSLDTAVSYTMLAYYCAWLTLCDKILKRGTVQIGVCLWIGIL